MENLKIRVKNEAEIKEAQELFLEYGATGSACLDKSIRYICTFNGFLTQYDFLPSVEFKQITMSELRDLVVLKRNSIDDATHEGIQSSKYYVSSSNNVYRFDQSWISANYNEDGIKMHLKPIGSVVKEYLDPRNGYKLIEAPESEALEPHASEWIKVPEGAEVAYFFKGNILKSGEDDIAFYKDNIDSVYYEEDWHKINNGDVKPFVLSKGVILWQRYTQPEELPFIDDEPKYMDGCSLGKTESLNDQYAEIEQVRQANTETDYLMQGKNGEKLMESITELKSTSAWDKQEGGSHYKKLAIQPMQYALANKLDYAQANVVKYVTRHADKNGKEDLLKAIHNIELMIEHYYG